MLQPKDELIFGRRLEDAVHTITHHPNKEGAKLQGKRSTRADAE
jgi:hypothetical protein